MAEEKKRDMMDVVDQFLEGTDVASITRRGDLYEDLVKAFIIEKGPQGDMDLFIGAVFLTAVRAFLIMGRTPSQIELIMKMSVLIGMEQGKEEKGVEGTTVRVMVPGPKEPQ